MSASKEVHRLIKNIDNLSGGQASIEDVNWEDGNIQTFKIVLKPNSGYYKGGRFEFQVYLDEDFPNSYDPPKVRCLTDIYHPNIYTCDDTTHDYYNRNICLNLLDKGTWDPAYGLGSIVLGLLFLLSNPNLDSIVHHELSFGEDDDEFEALVKQYMKGEEVDGHYFDAKFFTSENEDLDLSGEPVSVITSQTVPKAGSSNDIASNTSCDIDAMNMLCDDRRNSDNNEETDSSTEVLDKSDLSFIQKSEDNDINLRLLNVDGDTMLLNGIDIDLCDKFVQSTEVEMDISENDTESDEIRTEKQQFKPSLGRHGRLSTRSFLYHPYKQTYNDKTCKKLQHTFNGQHNVFRMKRTYTT